MDSESHNQKTTPTHDEKETVTMVSASGEKNMSLDELLGMLTDKTQHYETPEQSEKRLLTEVLGPEYVHLPTEPDLTGCRISGHATPGPGCTLLRVMDAEDQPCAVLKIDISDGFSVGWYVPAPVTSDVTGTPV